MECTGQVSQVTYRVPAGLITRVNGCYNDGATTLTNSIFPSSVAVAQKTVNLLVGGSIPPWGAKYGDVMELVYVLVLEAKFCEFESHRPHQFALLV